MSSWSVLLALQGFSYDGPKQIIGFQPVWQPADHASFFSAAQGWGLFTQKQTSAGQQSIIDLKFGTLDLKSLILAAPNGKQATDIRVSIEGKPLPISSNKQIGNRLEIELKQPAKLKAGSSSQVAFKL